MPPEDARDPVGPNEAEFAARLAELGMTVPPDRRAAILEGARQRRREVALLERWTGAQPDQSR